MNMPITDEGRHLTTRTQYQVRGVPGLNGVWFTETFDEQVDHATATTMCKAQGAVPQSLYEALAFRLVGKGANYSFGSQITRTTALIKQSADGPVMVLDDIAHPEQNVGLIYADQIAKECHSGSRFELPRSNEHVQNALSRYNQLPYIAHEEIKDGQWALNPRMLACLGNLASEIPAPTGRAYWGGATDLTAAKVIVWPLALCRRGSDFSVSASCVPGYVRGRML